MRATEEVKEKIELWPLVVCFVIILIIVFLLKYWGIIPTEQTNITMGMI